jgi:polyhydroxyalkanoate synthesis repressor PhaR
VIKKYANRRLYNTASSSYVTLDHLSEMVKEGVDFVVYDAKTNEDITRSVLTQIIFEEEGRGQNLLPIQFLRQLIGFYGNQMESFVPTYLEMSLEAFARQQERLREQMSGAIGAPLAGAIGAPLAGAMGAPPVGLGMFEDQVRQNLAMFDRAMKMFTPFAHPAKGDEAATAPAPAAAPASASAKDEDATIRELKRQMEEMQQKLAKLADKT